MCICICICVCVCVCMYVCMHVCMYVCMYVCMCVYVFMYVFMYVCMIDPLWIATPIVSYSENLSRPLEPFPSPHSLNMSPWNLSLPLPSIESIENVCKLPPQLKNVLSSPLA